MKPTVISAYAAIDLVNNFKGDVFVDVAGIGYCVEVTKKSIRATLSGAHECKLWVAYTIHNAGTELWVRKIDSLESLRG